MRHSLIRLALGAIAPVGLIFAGCTATLQPQPTDEPAYCSAYDPAQATKKGEADALNEPSSTKPCPGECSQCFAAYSYGYAMGLKQVEEHQCAVRRCGAQYPLTYEGPADPSLQAYYRQLFEACLNLEKLAAAAGRKPACDDAEIARLEKERDERMRELDRQREKCRADALREHPDKDQTWIDVEVDGCVDNWLSSGH